MWAFPLLPMPEKIILYKGPIWYVLAAHDGTKINEMMVGDALTYSGGQGNGT